MYLCIIRQGILSA